MSSEIESVGELLEEIERIDQNANTTFRLISELRQQNREALDRIEQLENEIQELKVAMPGQKYNKLQALLEILDFVEQVARGPAGATLTTREVMSRVNCSDRTARRYMDELSAFDWAIVREGRGREQNKLEIDLSKRSVEDCKAQIREEFDGQPGVAA